MNDRGSPSKKSKFDELFDEAEEDSFELENEIPTSIYDRDNNKAKSSNHFNSSTESMNIFGGGDKVLFNSKTETKNRKPKVVEDIQPSINVEPSVTNKESYKKESSSSIKDNSELLQLQKILQEANSRIALLNGELDNLKANYSDVCNKLTNTQNSIEPLKQQFIKLKDDNRKLIEDNTRLNKVSTSMTKKIDYYKSMINKKDEILNKYRDTIELISNNQHMNSSKTENKNDIESSSLGEHQNNNNTEATENSTNQQNESEENKENKETNASSKFNNKESKTEVNKDDKDNNESSIDELDLATRPGITRVNNPKKYSPIRIDFDDDVYKFINRGEFLLSKGSVLTSFKNSKGIGKVKCLGNRAVTLGEGVLKGYYSTRLKTTAKAFPVIAFASAFAGIPGLSVGVLSCIGKELYNVKKRGKYLDKLFLKHCRHVHRYFTALNEDGYKLKSSIKTVNDLVNYCKLLISNYPSRFFPEEIEDLKTFIRFANVYERVGGELCF